MLTAKPAPVDRAGYRYTECPFYHRCLNFAAKRMWEHFSCGECDNLALEGVHKKFRFIKPYYGIMSEIYPEFKTRYEPLLSFFEE